MQLDIVQVWPVDSSKYKQKINEISELIKNNIL